jgi:hypothetical protein
MKTIANLEEAEKLNVNIYELENSILNGDSKLKTFDFTFFIIEDESVVFNNYKTSENEVLLNTNEDVSYLIKKV